MDHSSAPIFIVFLFGFVAVAAMSMLFRWFRPEDEVKQALAATDRSPAGRLGPGVVRVTGRAVRAAKILTAPITGRACLAFQVDVEEAVRSSNHSHWRQVLSLSEAQPFYVEDESGRVLVEGGPHVSLALERDAEGGNGFFQRLVDDDPHLGRLETFLKERGVETETWLGFDKTHRYREGVIEEGEVVSVGGHAVAEPHPGGEAVLARGIPMRAVLRGNSETPLLISDAADAHGGG